MPIDFPPSPTTGQTYTYQGRSWIWNGTGWDGMTPTGLSLGRVLQVVSDTKTNFFNTSSTTFVDIPGLTATLTPRFASSRVLVTAQLTIGRDTAGDIMLNLVRDTTALSQASAGTNPATTFVEIRAANGMANPGITFLDSPNTLSPISYKIQMRVLAGTGFVNRRGGDTTFGGTCSITAMEIAS